ncbi:MAG: AAA family ATPase [Bacteroidetes bacterium]|nr:AAA family ATPase [Bacteroidota bacterium]
MAQYNYIYYGTKCSSKEVEDFLLHSFDVNARAEEAGRRKTPVCIWGQHGIGKTQLVEQIARERGFKWAYIAPAQFEEMGDLVGMPRIADQAHGKASTEFVAPDWVPQEEGPGILLIDDVNRADDRILRGIMQLLQNFELVSWKLPPKWQVVLTANPDGGDYSVTPMDFAMLTRMMHVSMVFDLKRWAAWAEQNNVDPRGINFVLTYPEVVSGERTTPRTLVQFFESIAGIDDLQENLGLVKMLGDACLDSATVTSFISFISNRLSKLPSPLDILNSGDFANDIAEPIRKMVSGETKRVDILSVISTRLFNYLIVNKIVLAGNARENVIQFLLMDFFPNDMRFMIGQDLMREGNDSLKSLWQHPELGQIFLENLL